MTSQRLRVQDVGFTPTAYLHYGEEADGMSSAGGGGSHVDRSIGSGDSRGNAVRRGPAQNAGAADNAGPGENVESASSAAESPVFLVLDSPVRSFLEIPISGDPTFDSIELQYLSCDSPSTGRAAGCFAALVHTPAGVDLYLDPEIGLDREWFDTDPAYANLERAGFHLTPVMVERWEIAADRIDIDASFQLDDGRTVSFRVDQERGSDRVLRQFIPTPAIQNLALLRFLQVDGFGLLRRTSRVEVAIDGQALTPARFALPLGGKRRYAARYAARCFVVGLNPQGEHQLEDKTADESGGNLEWTFQPLLEDPVPSNSTEGTVTFRMEIGQVATAQYCYRPTPEGFGIALTNVEQEWKPSKRNLQLWVLGLLRRLRRRNLTWHWSGIVSPAGSSRAGSPSAGTLTQSKWMAGHD